VVTPVVAGIAEIIADPTTGDAEEEGIGEGDTILRFRVFGCIRAAGAATTLDFFFGIEAEVKECERVS
jgi:hypothetical protein